MKRSEFLQLCRTAAMFSRGKPTVIYKGIEYWPEGYEMRFLKDGKTRHTAILRDRQKHNCLMYCDLKRVQSAGGEKETPCT